MRPRVLTHDIAGEGDPLVLIPGGLTGWLSWIPHQQRLSPGYRVIRVQPIPNELGSAGQPGDPTHTRGIDAESLLLTLEALEIQRAHFAGWSRGGKALIDFAGAHPDRIRSLTLVEPAAYWILEELGEADDRLEGFIGYLNSLAGTHVTEDDLAVFFASAGFAEDPASARAHPFWETAVPHRMALSWISKEAMASDLSLADLSRIDAPALVTKGTVTEAWEKRVVDLIGEYLPNARVVELEGDHGHHIESIDRFLEELQTHLTAA